jgi:hypothetical protein
MGEIRQQHDLRQANTELFIGTWKYLLASFCKRQLGQLKGNCIFILYCVSQFG